MMTLNHFLKRFLFLQLAFLLFITGNVFAQETVIWEENFDSYANGITTGTAPIGTNPSTWNITSSPAAPGIFAVRNGRFEGYNVGGTRNWLTTIDVSSYNYVKLSVDFMSSGVVDTGDQLTAAYSLDGGATYYIFENNGRQRADFSFITVSSDVLNVSSISSLIFRVIVQNNGTAEDAETYYFDNVKVMTADTEVSLPCAASEFVYLNGFNNGAATGWSTGGTGTYGVSDEAIQGTNTNGFVLSPSIAVSATDNITLSLDYWSDDDMEPADYMQFFYLLNGSAVETPFVTNPAPTGNMRPPSQATATFTGATSVRIKVYMRSNADETHSIDNVAVRRSAPTIALDFTVSNIITCNTPNATINTTGPNSGTYSYTWSSTNGSFAGSTDEDPLIPFQEGHFQVVVSDGTHSCTASAYVGRDVSFPNLTVDGGYINCSSPTATLNAVSTDVPGTTYLWTGPGITLANQNDPTVAVSAEGVYRATVTHPTTGCTNNASIVVGGPNSSALWVENFTGLANGTIADAGSTAWSRDVSATDIPSDPGSPQDRFFEVQNEKLKISYTVNSALPHIDAIWRSQVINISGLTSVQAFVDIQSEGNLNNDISIGQHDYINLYYILDGGAETLFQTNGANAGDVAPTTAYTASLSGSTLQIVIRAKNTLYDEVYYVDNVSVFGVRPSAVYDMTVSASVDNPITCTTPTPQLTATPPASSGATFSWTGPGSFTSSSATPNVTAPGLYTVVATGALSATGCVATADVTVVQNNTAPDVSASGQTICSGGTTSIAITNPNGVTATSFSWTRIATNVSGSSNGSGNNISQTLTSTDGINPGTVQYTITPASAAYPTGNGCVGTPLVVTVTVNPIPAAPAGSASQSFCSINNPTIANLSATGTAVQWYSAASGGSPLAGGTALVSGTTYYASQTALGCESSSRLAVTVTVADPAAPTGSAAQSFCSINNPTIANLAATGTAIQWYAAASGGSPLAGGTALVSGTTYYATQTVGGCESDTRLAVVATVNDPAAPTGSAAQSFCSINNPTVANLAATGTTIQWYAAAAGGSPLAGGTALVSGTTYYASQTVSGCQSDTRFAVTVTIADPAAPTGSAAQSFCSINNPTVANLSATGTAIQWYTTASGGSALAGGTALASGTYHASQTVSGCQSDTRFAVTVTVNDPAAPTGSAAQSFCSINNPTIASLSATGTAIQWYAAATGGSPLAGGTALVTGTTYHASQTTGGCESDTRLAVAVTVNDPAAPTGSATQSFCSINNPTIASLSATGTAIQWYAAASGGSPLAGGTALVTGTTYHASQTVGGCQSDTRFAVTVTVNDPAAPTGSAAQSFCSINNPTVTNLSATGTAIQWYAAASGGSALAGGTALVSGTTYHASQTVSGCQSDTRFAVTVTIADPAAPTGSATQNFCSINNPTVVSLVATDTSIQWYTAASGGSALAGGTALASGTYHASQTVGGCESDTRLAVTVTVNDPAAPTGSAAQSLCSINNPTVANLSATGTTIQWYAAATGGSPLASGTALVSGSTYHASQTVGGCESDTRLAVTVTVNDPASPTGSAAQSFCSINNPTIASLSATGAAIQWYAAASGGSPLAGGTALISGTTYYASQTVSGCESDTRLTVAVTVNDPAAPTGSAAQSFCSINNPTIASLSATGTTIQWYAAATGGSPLAGGTSLVSGTTYHASQTTGGCESDTRLAVMVTVNDPAAPTGSAAQSFCSIINPTVANLSATGTAIQWYAAATGGSPLAGGSALVSGSTYHASQTIGGCESDTRLAVAVTVNDPAAPTGSAAQSFCSIDNPTVADLSATGTAVQWYAAASGGSPLAGGTALVSGTTYHASQTATGCESDTRLAVTVTISIPSAPTGSAAQNFCSINNPTVTNLAATGTGIQWYAAASGGSPLAGGTTLVSGTTYYASQTVGSCESDTRFAVTVTIADPAAPTGSAAQNFCSIDSPAIADLSAIGTTIQWYAAASGGSALAGGTSLTTGTTYHASQTVGGCESDTRFAVTVTIADPAAPAGSAAQSFCSIDNPTVADLSATGTTIQWYTAATGGSPLAGGTALTTGTSYYASQTASGCESDTRFTAAVTVNDPAAPTGSAAQSFCSIDNPTIADLSATGTSIQWYAAATGGTALAGGTALTTGTSYYASQTVSGCESDTRLTVTVTISIPSSPTGSAAQSFCSINNPTVANLSATGTAIQWYTTATGGVPLGNGTALVSGATYYASQTIGSCESDTRLTVAVTVNDPAAPAGSAVQTFCSIDNPTVADLSATGTAIQWYTAATGGTPLAAGTALTTGTNYYATQTASGCESDTRFTVTVTVNDPAAPAGSATQSFCSIDNPTVADLSATGTSVQWYTAATGGSALASGTILTTATNYYASQTTSGCESDTRLTVAVTVNDPAAPTGSGTQNFCSINNPTVADLSASGASVQWFTAATGGSALASGTALTTATTYYASQSVAGCQSDTRLSVTVTVGDPAAPTGSATQDFCSIDNPAVADLSATGATIQWYAAATGGTPLAAGAALVSGTTYYASQTATGCESNTRLAVTVTIGDPAAPAGSATQNFCSINNPTVADLSAMGTAVQWYTVAANGTPLAGGTGLVSGTTYHASQTVAACESDTRMTVAVTIADPSAPAGAATQNFCSADNPVIANLAASGTFIQWYDAPSGGTVLSPASSVNGTTYYASQTISGCESDTRLPVVAVVTQNPDAATNLLTYEQCDRTFTNVVISNPNSVSNTTFTWTVSQNNNTTGSSAGSGNTIAQEISLMDGLAQGSVEYRITPSANGCPGNPVTVVITVNPGITLAATRSGDITCSNASVTLTATSPVSGVGFSWTGPGGFTDNSATPAVSEPGVYTVTASNGVSGCAATADVLVEENTTIPSAEIVSDGFFDFGIPTIRLVAITNATNATFNWTGPDGFTSDQREPVISSHGVYTVVVTDIVNGCVNSVTTEISPALQVSEGLSPNDDTLLDSWIIMGIENYPNNHVRLYNVWGDLVFEMKHYNNDENAWTGQVNNGVVLGSSNRAPDGTYYYLLDLGNGQKPLSGFVVLKR